MMSPKDSGDKCKLMQLAIVSAMEPVKQEFKSRLAASAQPSSSFFSISFPVQNIETVKCEFAVQLLGDAVAPLAFI